jgi:outer membrane protein
MPEFARRCTLGLLVATLFLPASAIGQSGQSGPAMAASQAKDPAGDTFRRLSMDDAVQLALEQNLSLQVQRLQPQLQDLSIAQAKTGWTPTFTTTLTTASSTSAATSAFSGADTLVADSFDAAFGATQLLPWGGNYSVSWDNAREKSNSVYASPNPSLSANLSASYTQPLLRNFKIDSTRQSLLISKKNREMTDVQLRQTVLGTVRNVKRAYWDVVYAIANLKVQQQSLDVARESLKNNRSRVSIGTMAPIDIIEAEAEVARNEEAVIVAEAAITRAEDSLRQLVFDPKNADFWKVRFEPTDQPVFDVQAVDVEAAVRTALDKRTDLVNARKNLEADDINIRYYKNQTLPSVNLKASYGLTGQGGTAWDYGLDYKVSDVIAERSYASTLRQMIGNDYHDWAFVVSVGYPLGKSSAEMYLARARLGRKQAELDLRNTEMGVATQVREAARTLNTNEKRVEATRKSRELAEKKLDAQQKKFQAGMTSNFEVIQAQRDLASARNSELSAIIDYVRSKVDFETVQEAPLSGGSIQLASTGS